MVDYVHGYSSEESVRLADQANALAELLHHDTCYPAGTQVLEVGCGVGAQTIRLVSNSPEARFSCIDISAESLGMARCRVAAAGFENASFHQADIFDLPFSENAFDHIFVCFVLEHLNDPAGALGHLKRRLKPGGTLTVIEGDHGSTYFYPDSRLARQTIQCLVDLQAEMGGDALIGRRLFPLLTEAGFPSVAVSPRMVYVDATHPGLVQSFTRETFVAMVTGVREKALCRGLMNEADWHRGIVDLIRTTEPDGVFCYTFFKALAVK